MKMPRLIPTLLLASTALLSACGPQQNQANSETEIHQWMDDFQRAFQAKDTKAIMALYTPDVLAYDIIPPLQYVGSDAYAKDWDTYFAGYQGPLTLEYRDCHITTEGNLAIVTCLEHTTGTLTNGQPSATWLRVTSGLRRVNGHWLDFHDHVSVPVDGTTGQARFDLAP
jgi:ketosteroid isomerase-like protein